MSLLDVFSLSREAYGHAQLFTPEKLEAVGQWCLEQLGGQGRMAYVACAGSRLLLIERVSL
jgi:hypothetical protein